MAGEIMKLEIGKKVEVKWGGDWWNAEIIDISEVISNRILIHYEGGRDEEDEWITVVDNSRVREPQDEDDEPEEEDEDEEEEEEEEEDDEPEEAGEDWRSASRKKKRKANDEGGRAYKRGGDGKAHG